MYRISVAVCNEVEGLNPVRRVLVPFDKAVGMKARLAFLNLHVQGSAVNVTQHLCALAAKLVIIHIEAIHSRPDSRI